MCKLLISLFFFIHLTKSSSSINQALLKEDGDIQYDIPSNDPTSIIFRGKGTLTASIAKAAQNKKKIIIEEGITEIADDAFYRAIWPVTENQNFTYEEVELPRSLVKIGAHAFSISGRELKKVHFPDYKPEVSENDIPEAELESFYSLREIGADAFARQPLTNHNIPGTFTEIGTRAFELSHLSHIRLNSKIKNIPAYTFMGCEHLTEIILPTSLTNISSNAFMNCYSLKKVTWKSSEVKFFGYDAFYGCGALEEFEFPPVGSGFQSSGEYFGNCFSLKRCVFPKKLTGTLGPSVFINCGSLKEVVLPDRTGSIPIEFFMNSSIETAFLPRSVSTIGSRAFKNCKNLKYVYITSQTMISADVDSFAGADNIDKMVFDGNMTDLNPNVFVGKVVCYNGIVNPQTFTAEAVNTSKTTIYLTRKFREIHLNQNFSPDTSGFEGFPYEIQRGNICALPTPSPPPFSPTEEPSEDDNKKSDESKKSLSTLTIVLIVVSCVAAIAIVAVVVVVILLIKKKRIPKPIQDSTNENL